jgi:hypothetical protein
LNHDAEFCCAFLQHRFGVGLGDVQHVRMPARDAFQVDTGPGVARPTVDDLEGAHPPAAELQPGQHTQRRKHFQAPGLYANRPGLGRPLTECIDHAHVNTKAGELAGGDQPYRSRADHQYFLRIRHVMNSLSHRLRRPGRRF